MRKFYERDNRLVPPMRLSLSAETDLLASARGRPTIRPASCRPLTTQENCVSTEAVDDQGAIGAPLRVRGDDLSLELHGHRSHADPGWPPRSLPRGRRDDLARAADRAGQG